MSGYTPGPWTVWPSLYEGMAAAVVRDVEPLETIAEVRKFANVRLIAAAPDLYEALEAIAASRSTRLVREVRLKVRAALAKARGETRRDGAA